MNPDERSIHDHVDELLSGYIDGELTQQVRQRVEIHLDGCEECRALHDELVALRRKIAGSDLSVVGEDKWREMMNDETVKTTYNVGWILFIGGILVAGLVGVVAFATEPSIGWFEKLVVFAIYGGLASLLVSVLRQRLIERKTDKYKDVEI